ncbi:MAG: hypothetical protein ABL963_01020 [Longimicrobiales bacterium]
MSCARRLLAMWFAAAGAACSDGVAPDPSDGLPLLFSLQAPAAVSQAEVGALSAAFGLVDTYHVTVQDSLSQGTLLDVTVSVTPGGSEHAIELALPRPTLGLPVLVTVVGLDGSQELYRTSSYLRVQDSSTGTPVALGVRYTGPGIRGRVTSAAGVPLAGVDVDLMQGNSLIGSVTTEPDGSYLFLLGGVNTGLYQVAPTPPGTQVVCPSLRNVNVVNSASSIVADFATQATACQIDLLIVSGGDLAFADDTVAVKALFAGVPNLTTRAFFFVNGPPGLNVLSQYDVVLLFANGLFNQSPVLGDQIEDYVQLGGNVITATFYWQNRSDSGLGSPGWGALEAFDPFTSGSGQTYQSATLRNDSTLIAHPLTAGLTTLTSTGFRGAVAAKANTTVVARWSDNSPLVGYQTLPQGSRMVAISLFPASGASATGNVATLWQNAATWAGAAGGPVP